MATIPTIDIDFKQLATSLITRSERGTAVLFLKDDTLAKGISWRSDASSNKLKATATGDVSTTETVTVTNVKYTKPVFIEDDGMITFSLPADADVTIIGSANTGASNVTINVDNTELALASNKYTTKIQAGKHTITAGSGDAWVYAIEAKCTGVNAQVYKNVTDIDEDMYSDTNLKHIKKCLNYAPYEVVVISNNTTTLANYTKALMNIRSTGWIASPETSIQADLASWIKSQESEGNTYKAVGTVSGKDCKQYVYFNQTSTDNEGNKLSAVEYLPSLVGIIASCNINRGCTNFECTDLSDVADVTDVGTAVGNGQLVLANDIGGVKIVAGINSLVTLNGNTATEDMQYIETVEAMHLIKDDIKNVFKNTYQGKFKNKYNYQMLLIGAINQYLSSLENEDILDNEFDNIAEIDIDAQRKAWIGAGKSEAEEWSENKVKTMAYKRTVFVKGNIKILNCMENLKFTITLV